MNCSESAPWVKGKECVGLLIYRATLNDSCPTASSEKENVGISERKENVTVSPDQTYGDYRRSEVVWGTWWLHRPSVHF